MSVVNITPDDKIRNFAAGTVPGIMHVYCIGGPGQTGYVIEIGNGEPTEHFIDKGHTDTYNINGQTFNFRNYGPSTLQLLWATAEVLDEVSQLAEPSAEQRFQSIRKG